MSDLPAPLVPADVDLRDFPYLPLDIVRLFGSDFHAQSSDAEWRAGVTLWLRSYHQVPAGSLPDDEVALTRLAELGRDVRSWRKIAAGALRGWTRCSDGRLYHRTVGEKALEGWIEKLLQRKSSEAGNAKRYGHPFDPAPIDEAIEASLKMLAALNPQSRVLKKRSGKSPAGTADVSPDRAPGGPPTKPPTGSPDGNPDCFPHHSQEKGREGNRKRDARDARLAFDAEFWPRYPHKVGKPAAQRSFEKLWRELHGNIASIIAGLERYCRDKPADRPWLNPATFLNQRRFDDEPASPSAPTLAQQQSPRIDFGGGVSWPETTVRMTVNRWRDEPATWPADRLGPPPGAPGCRVPERLLEAA